MEWLDKSGVVGYILAGISVVTLAVFLERFFMLQLERYRIKKGAGIMAKIKMLIDDNFGMNISRLEELVSFRAEEEIERISSGIGLIRLSSAVSPLLGLLGTVLGMIEAFKQVSEMGGSVKPAVLASGIWVALLTTAEGLVIAITAFLMHHYLQFVVSRIGKYVTREADKQIIGVQNGSTESQPQK